MRCPDCNKFVSYDDSSEPETNIEIDAGGTIGGDVRVALTCAECGSDLKEASFDVEEDVSDQLREHMKTVAPAKPVVPGEPEEDESEVEASYNESNVELTSRTEGKGRGLKTFYGFRINYDVTCGCAACKAPNAKVFTIEGELADEIQASSMDECC